MTGNAQRRLAGAALALLPILAIACGPDGSPDSVGPDAMGRPSLIGVGSGDGLPNFEEIEVCKYGSSASITVAMTQASGNSTVTHDLADGECSIVGTFDGNNPADITATESGVASGFEFDSLRYHVIRRNPSSVDPVVVSTTNAFAYAGADNRVGILVEFFNSAIEVPPGGGEGCTPGYWKQSHHFDSWVGYSPNQQFSSVFENAFPGKTLLQVLSAGGNSGGEALGRHTVAALLNSANAGVSYDLTTADVIAEFNAAWPGSKNTLNALKDRFGDFNEQGCPLN